MVERHNRQRAGAQKKPLAAHEVLPRPVHREHDEVLVRTDAVAHDDIEVVDAMPAAVRRVIEKVPELRRDGLVAEPNLAEQSVRLKHVSPFPGIPLRWQSLTTRLVCWKQTKSLCDRGDQIENSVVAPGRIHFYRQSRKK
jgi:hypothetical protein